MSRKTITRSTLALLLGLVLGATPARAAEADSPPLRAMDAAVERYVALCAGLAADEADGVPAQVRALRSALAAVAKAKGDGGEVEKLRGFAREAAGVLEADEDELESGDNARVRKRLMALSKPFVRYVGWLRPGGARWKTYYCSMAKGSWLQPAADAKLANPYYGKKMLRCGDPVRTRGEAAARDGG